MKNEGLRTLTKEEMQDLGRNPSGVDVLSEGKAFGRRKKAILSGEKWKNESDFAVKIFKEISTWWIEDMSRCCWALNLDKYESVKVLLRICQQQKHLDGSKSCREAIDQTKTFSMDQEVVEKLLRQIPDNSMDQIYDKICREKKSKGLDK